MKCFCNICFRIISAGPQKPLVTHCGHLFHEECIVSCLQNDVGKCPQCKEPIKSSKFIQLNISERRSSGTKDNLIRQLQYQVQELNKMAQLQSDLIASLNRQIVMQKELSRVRNREVCSQFTSTAPTQGRIVALGNATEPDFGSLVMDQTIAQRFAFGSSSQTLTLSRVHETIPSNGFDKENGDSIDTKHF